MVKEKGVKLRYVYGIFFALWSVFGGALFIMQIWSIYRSAPQSPYSAESISKHFNEIAIPVWIWLAALLGSILLSIAFPEREQRPKAYVDAVYALSRAKKGLPEEEEFLKTVRSESKKQSAFRGAVYAVCGAVMLAAGIVCLLVLFDVVYYPLVKTAFFAETNGVADRLVQCTALCAAAFTLACVGAILNARSRNKERLACVQAKVDSIQAKKSGEKKSRFSPAIDAFASTLLVDKKRAKTELEKGAKKAMEVPKNPAPVQVEAPPKKESKKAKTVGTWSLRAVIFAVAVLLIFIGVQNGGMRETFLKAINICTQCIGLG